MAAIDRAELLLQAKNYSGSGNWLDESGNAHDATITGVTYTAAGADSYFSFDGIDDYMVITDHANLDFAVGVDFTIMGVWANVENAADVRILSKRTGGTLGWMLQDGRSTAYKANFFVGDGIAWKENVDPSSHTAVPKHTFVGRYDSTPDEIELFVDGTSVDTDSMATVTGTKANSVNLEIGRFSTSYGQFDLLAVAIWREALSDVEISGLPAELAASGASSTMMLLGSQRAVEARVFNSVDGSPRSAGDSRRGR